MIRDDAADQSATPPTPGPGGDGRHPAEMLIAALDPAGWVDGVLPGLRQKVLWQREPGGASIALSQLAAGAGIPERRTHPSNHFIYCLSGSYAYTRSGLLLEPGSFYWNPAENAEGPTEAQEDCLLLEVFDGPSAASPAAEEDPALYQVGTSLLHTNELVNIWEVNLAPGQEHPWHRHRYPYLVITVEAGRALITSKLTGDQLEGQGVQGNVTFDPGGQLHKLANIGDRPIVDRLIELKAVPPTLRPARIQTATRMTQRR